MYSVASLGRSDLPALTLADNSSKRARPPLPPPPSPPPPAFSATYFSSAARRSSSVPPPSKRELPSTAEASCRDLRNAASLSASLAFFPSFATSASSYFFANSSARARFFVCASWPAWSAASDSFAAFISASCSACLMSAALFKSSRCRSSADMPNMARLASMNAAAIPAPAATPAASAMPNGPTIPAAAMPTPATAMPSPPKVSMRPDTIPPMTPSASAKPVTTVTAFSTAFAPHSWPSLLVRNSTSLLM